MVLEVQRLRPLDALLYLAEAGLFILASPLHLRNLFVRLREGRYRGIFAQRLWGPAEGDPGSTLLIASGLGETHQAIHMKAALPGKGKILSQLSRTFKDLADMPGNMSYAPFKWPIGAILTLKRQRPDQLVFVGVVSDIHLAFWAKMFGIPILLIHTNLNNRRLEKREARLLGKLRFRMADRIAVRSEDQIERLVNTGVAKERISLVGPQLRLGHARDPDAIRSKWQTILGAENNAPVIVAGSTHPLDEEVVLDAMAKLWKDQPEVRLVLVPRRLDRPEGPTSVLDRLGLVYAMGSKGIGPNDRLILLDSVGELSEVYSVASVVFVGGTFVPKNGGHSFAEALEWDVWFTCGPGYGHQAATANELASRGLLQVCQSSEELTEAWRHQLVRRPMIDLMDQSMARIAALLKD